MKFFKKLKTIPKAALIPIAFFLLVSLLFTAMFFTIKVKKDQKVAMSSANVKNAETQMVSNQSNESKKVEIPGFIQSALEKEKKVLEEKKKYFGEINPNPQNKDQNKTSTEQKNLETAKQKREETNPGALPPPPPPPASQFSYPQGRIPAYGNETQEIKEVDPKLEKARAVYEKIYGKEAKAGSVFVKKSKEKGENNTSVNATDKNGSLSSFGLLPGKYYKARIETPITSEKPNAVVIAVLEEGLKGAKLFGKITGVFEGENKLDVVFSKMIYQNKEYNIQALSFDLSKAQGIASNVQYNILSKIFIQGGLGFSRAAMDALREDTKVQVMSPLGTVQVSENKTDNRFREAMLSGGSQAFSETQRIVSQYQNKIPDKVIILAKNTPFFVMFFEGN